MAGVGDSRAEWREDSSGEPSLSPLPLSASALPAVPGELGRRPRREEEANEEEEAEEEEEEERGGEAEGGRAEEVDGGRARGCCCGC